jgi:succinyl-CoA synthetase beta subunit
MHLHEYQAKEVLSQYGVPISPGRVATSREEAALIAKELGLTQAVVKVQVHAGGRGKAGGVRFAKGRDEIEKAAEALLGMRIINEQTGPEGLVAHKVLIAAPVDIKRECYLSIVFDRKLACPVLIASAEGGMDIEELAVHSPEKVLRMPISIHGDIRLYQLVELNKLMGWTGEQAAQANKLVKALARAFVDKDSQLLEINPLGEDTAGKLWALDCKWAIDDNALFRHPDLKEMEDLTQLPEMEVMAKEHDLSYVALDGNIGCMVNGAGLAMATLDIIHHYGGAPANFLDVGGSATEERVTAAFSIILSDRKVNAILVNIFGGIMNCATIARGLVSAVKTLKSQTPLVVRLEGTNVEEGRKILQESGIPCVTAEGLDDAAQKAVAAAQNAVAKGRK